MASRYISPANQHNFPTNSKGGDYAGASQMQLQVDRLRGHIRGLSEFQGQTELKLNEVDSKLVEANSKLDSLASRMAKMDSKFDAMEARFFATRDPNAEFPGTSRNPNKNHEQPRSSTTPIQVSTPNLELNRETSSLGYRAEKLNMTNRDNMLKKIERPMFTGKQPCIWLIEVERFFHIGRYTDEEKLDLVSLSLEGKVRQWYYWELGRKGFRNWTEFKTKLILRFSESMEETPEKKIVPATALRNELDITTPELQLKDALPSNKAEVPEATVESFSQHEALETGSLLQMEEAIGTNELLVTKIAKESSLEKVSHQTEAISRFQSATVSIEVHSPSGLEDIIEKPKAHQLFDNRSFRRQKRQRLKKRGISPKSWMFKYKHQMLRKGAIQVFEVSRDMVRLMRKRLPLHSLQMRQQLNSSTFMWEMRVCNTKEKEALKEKRDWIFDLGVLLVSEKFFSGYSVHNADNGMSLQNMYRCTNIFCCYKGRIHIMLLQNLFFDTWWTLGTTSSSIWHRWRHKGSHNCVLGNLLPIKLEGKLVFVGGIIDKLQQAAVVQEGVEEAVELNDELEGQRLSWTNYWWRVKTLLEFMQIMSCKSR